jgi:hypothetical protein
VNSGRGAHRGGGPGFLPANGEGLLVRDVNSEEGIEAARIDEVAPENCPRSVHGQTT